MNTQVDKKIHDLRSYLGLSLKAFGDAIDYTGTHILRIEQKAVNPSEQFIQKVCEGLHVDPEYFTGEMPVERRRRRAENLRRKAEREMKKLVKLLTEAGVALTPENIRALGDIA